MVPGETWPAKAIVAALGVDANTVVAQRVTVQFTFVHIDVTVLTCERNFTLLDFREKEEWFCAPRCFCFRYNMRDMKIYFSEEQEYVFLR